MGQMWVLAYTVKKWRQNAADRPRIDSAIRMAADAPVHGTGVQAGPTADTLQTFTKRRTQNLGPAVVQDNEVKRLRSIQLAGAAHSRQDGGIDRKRLPGRSARQQLEERRQVA